MIITKDESQLRKKCEKVLESEINDLISVLEKELNASALAENPGVGLAAPQIGIYKDIAIIRYDDYKINLINSKIEKAFDKVLFKGEGCLSFPGELYNTVRYNEVHIKNEFSNSFIATGFLAVVCQHEIDHLNSNLFFDRKISDSYYKLLKSGKIKPTDNCPCGSVNPHSKQPNKFKKCCGEIIL